MVGALEEREMVGLCVQFDDQTNGIWEKEDLQMTPGFGLIIWKDKADRTEVGELIGSWFRGMLCRDAWEIPTRDIEQIIGAVELDTEEGS